MDIFCRVLLFGEGGFFMFAEICLTISSVNACMLYGVKTIVNIVLTHQKLCRCFLYVCIFSKLACFPIILEGIYVHFLYVCSFCMYDLVYMNTSCIYDLVCLQKLNTSFFLWLTYLSSRDYFEKRLNCAYPNLSHSDFL